MKTILPISLSTLALLPIIFYPDTSFITSIVILLLSLALSTYSIYTKHKGTEHARVKILKEVGVMVLTLVIILFLGGITSMLANYQVGMRWGVVAGFASAIAASFAVGYLVRVGMGRVIR